MMTIYFSAALAMLTIMTGAAIAAPMVSTSVHGVTTEFDHGGGCRKSSPRGQCCHMETKTGRVHCH